MIERDTGHPAILEEGLLSRFYPTGIDGWLGNARKIKPPVVLQAPVLLERVAEMPDWFVVFMQRDMKDVFPSALKMIRKIILDIDETKLLEQLRRKAEMVQIMQGFCKGRHIVVPYEALRKHPLWVEDRSGFGLRDTYVDSRASAV
jgi:hypothetical protein